MQCALFHGMHVTRCYTVIHIHAYNTVVNMYNLLSLTSPPSYLLARKHYSLESTAPRGWHHCPINLGKTTNTHDTRQTRKIRKRRQEDDDYTKCRPVFYDDVDKEGK